MVTSVTDLIGVLDEERVEHVAERLDGAIGFMLITEDADGMLQVESASVREGREALSEAIQFYGACAVESHRRMVVATKAFQELYGEDS